MNPDELVPGTEYAYAHPMILGGLFGEFAYKTSVGTYKFHTPIAGPFYLTDKEVRAGLKLAADVYIRRR